ncbi:hypothetical protein WR25_19409 [Diploscapter pachys]|uniref:G-protein coupled receptors family 1 profile domain-containing protein n=1 Tax=Diploscapter pachys TaxID=2018661 RepID=A0A2A2K9H8_9BILA|nr:hypothetical protein WR25_19409 [Diploscapter pachys]
MNIVNMTAYCGTAINTVSSPLYSLPLLMAILSGLTTLFVFGYTLATCKMLMHFNAMVLLKLAMLYASLFSIIYTSLAGFHLIRIVFAQDNCDVVYLAEHCSIWRRITLTTLVAMTTTNVAQMVERMWATINYKTYEKSTSKIFVALLSTSTLLSSWGSIEWAMREEDLSEYLTSCASFSASPKISANIYIIFYFIFAADIIILIIFYILLRRNKISRISAQLTQKFQMKENIMVLRTLAPIIIANAICFCIYALFLWLGRFIKNFITPMEYKYYAVNSYIIPYISFITSIVIYHSLKQEERRRHKTLSCITTKVDPVTEMQKYFDRHFEQWKKPK